MPRVLAWILALFACSAAAQQVNNLVTVNTAWEIVDSTHVGARTRIESFNQNPYPFCFSYAASALFDQTRCHADGLADCRQQPRSSALTATPAGQRLPADQLNVNSGGVTRFSLNDLVTRGFVPQAQCNTDFGQETDMQLNQRMNSGRSSIYPTYQSWQKYQDWTPYLANYYRHFFVEHAANINPTLGAVEIELLAKQAYSSQEQLMGAVLLGGSCRVPRFRDDRFRIRSAFVGEAEKFDPVRAHDVILKNLKKNRPVSVDFCIMGNADQFGECVTPGRHAAVIVATARAQHRATGDMRTVYWIVNTWGEQWQQKNRDGWVFADKLLHGIYGHILWLEEK
jgi:hypothetical protein